MNRYYKLIYKGRTYEENSVFRGRLCKASPYKERAYTLFFAPNKAFDLNINLQHIFTNSKTIAMTNIEVLFYKHLLDFRLDINNAGIYEELE